jgi:hypothetical protein
MTQLKVKLMCGEEYNVDENDMITIDGETYVYWPETGTFKSTESDNETDDVIEFWEVED